MKYWLAGLLAGLLCACSEDVEETLCTFDEEGRIVRLADGMHAECVEPAPVPTGAKQKKSGRLTILEAPLPPPFSNTGSAISIDEAGNKNAINRPPMPLGISYYIRAFPVAKERGGDILDLSSQHTIILRDGCFYLDRDGENDPLLMYPHGTALIIDQAGYLAIASRLNNQTGSVRVGLPAETGWFSEPFDAPPELAKICGARQMVSVTTVSNPFAHPERFSAAMGRYRERSGVSAKQAVDRANGCAIEQAQRSADRRLGRTTADPLDCNRFWGF